MIKAHCVSQEYWYIATQQCPCGGKFQDFLQELRSQSGVFVDVIASRCDKCGTARDFIFDISSFHNPFRSFQELAKVEASLNAVYTEEETAMKMASPMEATLMYIRHLEELHDVLALEYLSDTVQRTLKKGGT